MSDAQPSLSERPCWHHHQRNEWLDAACDVLLNHCEDCGARLAAVRLPPFIPGTLKRVAP